MKSVLREIRVYGRLAKFLKRRVFHAEIATAAEAVRFLVTNFPELEAHMATQHYRVISGDYSLTEDELHHPTGSQPIKIIPVMAGAITWRQFFRAAARIVAGIALVAVSFIPGFAAWAGPTAILLLKGAGTMLALQGVSSLISPTPVIKPQAAPAMGPTNTTRETELDPQKSYSFSGIHQTSRSGTPVPLIYGETIVGSIVISTGIDTVTL